jgi:hypothetical protein
MNKKLFPVYLIVILVVLVSIACQGEGNLFGSATATPEWLPYVTIEPTWTPEPSATPAADCLVKMTVTHYPNADSLTEGKTEIHVDYVYAEARGSATWPDGKNSNFVQGNTMVYDQIRALSDANVTLNGVTLSIRSNAPEGNSVIFCYK